MRKTWIAGLALALATASPALAAHHHGASHHSTSNWSDDGGGGSFSAGTLNGMYVFEGAGFADDGKPGEVAVLGTLTFDGAGGVGGNLIFTRGDNAQFSCNDTFSGNATPSSTTGSYALQSSGPPGTYTMQIPLVPTGTPATNSAGTINFGILVPSQEGKRGDVIETDSGSLKGVIICDGNNVTSMTLKGHLKQLEEGGNDD
jgi:hypothetical protein